MHSRFGLILAAAAVVALSTAAPSDVHASCEMDDFFCKKFKSKPERKAKRAAPRKRATVSKPRPRVRRAAVKPANPIEPQKPELASLNSKITAAAPPVTVTFLKSGAIAEPPGDLRDLVFSSSDRIEVATAQCGEPGLSARRIKCALAVNQLTINGTGTSGCTTALGLRQMEFSKTDEGDWVNEDSIALCGGRLLRRAELFPVALDGTPRYALRESYQMLGGDPVCAAPYLSSRKPLRKTYTPVAKTAARSNLACETVAAR